MTDIIVPKRASRHLPYIVDPLRPAFYSPVNQALLAAAGRDVQATRDRWEDEAAEAALAGNPKRAHYLEDLARRRL